MIEIEQKQQTQITIPCLKSMRMETQIAHNLHSIVWNDQSLEQSSREKEGIEKIKNTPNN